MPRSTPLVLATLVLAACVARAHSSAGAIADMTHAAQAWLDSLSAEQRRGALLAFSSDERENWHYVPRSREGIALGQMDAGQREKARALLASGLSQHGLLQTDAVIALERVLRVVEGADYRDELRYHFTIFDQPRQDATWGWRVEGHHLSINFTIVQGRHVVATPHFVGANPAEVRIPGPQSGKRALADEETLAREFMRSLDDRQRARAVFSKSAPSDILTRAQRKAAPLNPNGLSYTDMSPEQQKLFQALFAVYVDRLRPELAEVERARVAQTGWENLHFAWAGGIEPGQGHYYRIQGPEFVIEYDNTQNGANHIHTVWRSFNGDFGRDLLQEHYQDAHR